MNAALLALLIAGGGSVWVYTKLQDRTGRGNNKAALQGAAICFVFGFLVAYTVARMLIK